MERETARTERQGFQVSWKLVMAALAALTIAAAVGAFVIFKKYIQYDRTAALHLPPDTTAAARVDVEKLALFDPARRHLFPLLDDSFGNAGPSSLPSRHERIEVRTGVDLSIGLREIVVARGPRWSDWVLVLSGKFPRTGVVTGMAKVLSEEGAPWHLAADRKSLLGPGGVALGQATDGSIILASTAARLAQALPRQDTYRRIGLDNKAAAAAVAAGPLVRSYASSPAHFVAPSLQQLAAVQRLSVTVKLGHPLQATVHVTLLPGRDAAAMKKPFEELLAGLVRISALVPGQDFAGERAVLGRAAISVAGPHELDVRFAWKPKEVDRGATSLARAVRRWDGAAPGPRSIPR